MILKKISVDCSYSMAAKKLTDFEPWKNRHYDISTREVFYLFFLKVLRIINYLLKAWRKSYFTANMWLKFLKIKNWIVSRSLCRPLCVWKKGLISEIFMALQNFDLHFLPCIAYCTLNHLVFFEIFLSSVNFTVMEFSLIMWVKVSFHWSYYSGIIRLLTLHETTDYLTLTSSLLGFRFSALLLLRQSGPCNIFV